MHVIVNKLLTTYNQIGSGDKTILFLHGWADSGKTFDMLAREVIAANKDYSALIIDLPGFGGTASPPGAWDLSDYAAFTADFLKKLNKEPVAIVGHSNGGAIAINGLSNGILQSHKLILIGSAGIRDSSTKKVIMKLLAKPAKIAIKATPKSTQKRIRQKLYTAVGSDYLIAEHMQETFKKVVGYDVRSEASQLKMPVCLIYGEKDTATPPAYGEILAAVIPKSKLHVIPLVGHFVHQEQAHNVARISLDFIGEKVS